MKHNKARFVIFPIVGLLIVIVSHGTLWLDGFQKGHLVGTFEATKEIIMLCENGEPFEILIPKGFPDENKIRPVLCKNMPTPEIKEEEDKKPKHEKPRDTRKNNNDNSTIYI